MDEEKLKIANSFLQDGSVDIMRDLGSSSKCFYDDSESDLECDKEESRNSKYGLAVHQRSSILKMNYDNDEDKLKKINYDIIPEKLEEIYEINHWYK